MHGGIDEKRKNSPCVGGKVGKRAVNKGSMNEKESAREANNRGFHESCSRVIPSFRIFRLARLGARKSFFLNRTYHNWNIFLSARRKNSSISIAPLSLSHPVSPCSSARNHETTTDIDTWPHAPGTTLQIRGPGSCTGLSIIAGLSFAPLCPMERDALWGL